MSKPLFLQLKWNVCQVILQRANPPVPAESTIKSSESLERIMPSAKGERQIFPKQTIKIL